MSPKSKQQFAEIRAESEQKILRSALELFANQGFEATSISQIAKEAGVSKGLMYNYFESKLELLRCIISNAVNDGKAIVNHAIQDYDLPEDELEHLVLDSIEYVIEHPQLSRLLGMLVFQEHIIALVKDIADDSRKWSIAKGVEIFEKLGSSNPMVSALLLGASLDGLILYYLSMNKEFPIREMGKKLVDTFIDKHSIHRK